MNQITRIATIGSVIATVFNAAPLWAATAAREDNSDLFVWIFMAFCALVVVAQLIPAIMMLLGFAKGMKKESAQATPSTGPADHT